MKAAALGLLVALAAAPAAAAQGTPGTPEPGTPGGQGTVIGGSGKRGASIIGTGTCRYGVFGPRGVLRVGVAPPAVSGANIKRRTRNERTRIRYRVYVTDVFRANATLQVSGWSAWIRVRERDSAGWSSPTFFDMDWRGNYGADIRIEWWNSKRMVGYRAHRLIAFNFFDQYNRGPMGPIASCYKYTNY